MSHIALLTASNMPDCAATAAYAKVSFGWDTWLAPHTSPLDLAVRADTSALVNGKPRELYIIGTFWKAQLSELARLYYVIYVYSFGDDMADVPKNCTIFRDTGRVGAIEWLEKYSSEARLPMRANAHDFHRVCRLSNVRCFGEGDEDCKSFFTGVYDISARPDTDGTYSTFLALFKGELALETVCKAGATLIANHRGIAAERVRKNGTYHKDWLAATEGPELINLTHEALYAAYPSVCYTIVYRFAPNLRIAISVRAYGEDADALQLLREIGDAGGSRKAAGTIVEDTRALAQLLSPK